MKTNIGPGFVLSRLAILIGLSCGSAHAALTHYASRVDFNTDNPQAVFEDFEEANVADGDTATMENQLDASTNNDIFSSNDIVDGLRISVGDAGDVNNLFVSSPGFATYVSHAISFLRSATTAPQIRVDFLNENVLAFALDLTSNPNGNDLTVNVFSGISNLGSTLVINVQGTGTFLGMRSDTEVITHITISNGNYFGVDDIAFAVPEPTAVALTGIGVALMTLRRAPKT